MAAKKQGWALHFLSPKFELSIGKGISEKYIKINNIAQ